MERTWKESGVSLIVAGAAVLFGLGASSGAVPVFAILMTLVIGLTVYLVLPVVPSSAPAGEFAAEDPKPKASGLDLAA